MSALRFFASASVSIFVCRSPMPVVADKLLEACLCIAPGHLPLHVQYVWDADMPW